MESLHRYFQEGFQKALAAGQASGRRIGAELKFPLVDAEGRAVERQKVDALWKFLSERGWRAQEDAVAGKVVGASKPGPLNDTVASCETGYCKTEFSLAHEGDLFALKHSVDELIGELREFSAKEEAYFLGYGIQPITPPSKRLLMKQGRTSVWDRFAANRHIAPQDGDDMHLFTINAASHVHVSVNQEEAVAAVNVLNGFAGAQIALTADSRIWRGGVDPKYRCPTEMFWDWWMTESHRVGVPPRPFQDLRDYLETVASFKPVFVKRDGQPITLPAYESFAQYFACQEAAGRDISGNELRLEPRATDLDVHSTCYWYNARISHYYTVENRVNDQQPPGDLLCVAALTLGLVSAADLASEELAACDWEDLKSSRPAACEHALAARSGALELAELAGRMLETARQGLKRRGLGEEVFLEPLFQRLQNRKCPADQAAELFTQGGIQALIEDRRL